MNRLRKAIESSSSSRKALFYASIAVLAWSLGAYLCCSLVEVPLLQLLAVSQILGSVSLMLWEKKIPSFQQFFNRLSSGWPFFCLLICNQGCYVYAFRVAPAAHVDLINYTWPVLLVMGESMRERRFLTVLEILGMTLCFLGLAVLFLPELLGASVLSSYFLGYLAAGLAALSWTTYSILCRESYNSEGFDRSMSLDILLSGIVFTILHSCIGTWSLPNPSTSLVIVIFSVLCYGIAFPFWRRSLQLGHYSFVSGLANMIPILSVFWLVLGGIVSFSVGLVYATLLVSLGCYFLNQQSYKQQESFVRLKIKTKMVLNK